MKRKTLKSLLNSLLQDKKLIKKALKIQAILKISNDEFYGSVSVPLAKILLNN